MSDNNSHNYTKRLSNQTFYIVFINNVYDMSQKTVKNKEQFIKFIQGK